MYPYPKRPPKKPLSVVLREREMLVGKSWSMEIVLLAPEIS